MWFDPVIADQLNTINISQKLGIPPQSIGVEAENEGFVRTLTLASRVVSEIEAEEARKIEEATRYGRN